jgi:hypothetical protein
MIVMAWASLAILMQALVGPLPLHPHISPARAAVACMQANLAPVPPSWPALAPLRTILDTDALGSAITIDAWIYARRTLGHSVSFFTLGDGSAFHDDDDGALLPQAVLSGRRVDEPDLVRELARLAAPGSQVRIRGVVELHERGWPSSSATSWSLGAARRSRRACTEY